MRSLIVASALAMLAACGQQHQQQGATTPAEGASQAATPPLPAWAAQYVGQSFATAFPNENRNCLGGTDRANVDGAVAHIIGWSWDRSASRAYDHLVSVGPDGIINGAGTTVRDRPDVVRARGDTVTDSHVGFDVVSTATSGVARIAALGPDSGAFCWIERISY